MRQMWRAKVKGVLTSAVALVAAFVCTSALALELSPSNASVAIRFYGLGLIPIDGTFDRFSGRLELSPDRRNCDVLLQVDVNSLAMPDRAIREDVLSEMFLDAGRYPALVFTGRCEGEAVRGALTLHGVTRPFTLNVEREASGVAAVGRLVRAEWGITARPLVGGTTVRIKVRVKLPPG